ncbi:MAG: preprotein translocase subunit SecE [Chitinivibrionales bacterium]
MQYLKGVRYEMAKVSWPTRGEVVGATTLVVVLSIAVSIVVKVFDIGLSQLLGLFLNL